MTPDEIRDIVYLANDVLQLRHQYDGYLDEVDKRKLIDVYRKIIMTIPEEFELKTPKIDNPFGLDTKDSEEKDFDF